MDIVEIERILTEKDVENIIKGFAAKYRVIGCHYYERPMLQFNDCMGGGLSAACIGITKKTGFLGRVERFLGLGGCLIITNLLITSIGSQTAFEKSSGIKLLFNCKWFEDKRYVLEDLMATFSDHGIDSSYFDWNRCLNPYEVSAFYRK